MRRFRLLGAVVAVETESEVVARLLDLLWAPFSVEDGAPDAVLTVLGDDEAGWTVERTGQVPSRHADVWNLVDVLRHYMLNDADLRGGAFVLLHAAGVVRGGHALLLAGASGTGKTTLTRALLDAGWSYLSDDLVPIDLATGRAHPFPKPLGIKDPGAWPSMRAPLGPAGDLPRPAGTFLAPASSWSVAAAPASPSHVVFPQYRAGAETTVQQVPAAEGAARLAAHVRERGPQALAATADLARRCACFDLAYGSPGAAVTALERLAGAGA